MINHAGWGESTLQSAFVGRLFRQCWKQCGKGRWTPNTNRIDYNSQWTAILGCPLLFLGFVVVHFQSPISCQRLSDSSVLKLRTLFGLWITDQFRLLILLFKKAQLVDISWVFLGSPVMIRFPTQWPCMVVKLISVKVKGLCFNNYDIITY